MSEATDNAETVEGTVEAPAAETVVTDRPEWLQKNLNQQRIWLQHIQAWKANLARIRKP